MGDHAWLWLGGTAALGTLAAVWRHVKTGYNRFRSLFLVTFYVSGSTAMGDFALWLQRDCRLGFGVPEHFVTEFGYLKEYDWAFGRVLCRNLIPPGPRTWWYGRIPLWVSVVRAPGISERDSASYVASVTVVRGLIKPAELLLQITAAAMRRGLIAQGPAVSRHAVTIFSGTANKPLTLMGSCSGPPSKEATSSSIGGSDLNTPVPVVGCMQDYRLPPGPKPTSDLALSDEQKIVLEEIRYWLQAREWFKARRIPWRRGIANIGPPGSGKTAFVRVTGLELDLPVFSMDLATMYNSELREFWQIAKANAPCIVLLDDIDAVFHGRENVTQGPLTFDCLLNCIDGIEEAEGVLLFINTNCPEQLDPALGITESGQSSRPGRCDRILKFGALSFAGRLQLAKRMLPDCPEMWEEVVAAGNHDVGAQFQERCTELALAHYRQAAQKHVEDVCVKWPKLTPCANLCQADS